MNQPARNLRFPAQGTLRLFRVDLPDGEVAQRLSRRPLRYLVAAKLKSPAGVDYWAPMKWFCVLSYATSWIERHVSDKQACILEVQRHD